MARLAATPKSVRTRFNQLFLLEARTQSEHPEISGPTLHEAKILQGSGRSARSSKQRAFLAACERLILLERQFNEESIASRGLSRRKLRAYLTQLDRIQQYFDGAAS